MIMNLLYTTFIGALAWMTVGAVLQQLKKDMGLVDVFWSAGVGLAAAYLCLVSEGEFVRRMFAMSIGLFWSTRLASQLFLNRVWRKSEDSRYATLRRIWKKKAPLYFFLIFEAQALLIVLFAAPFAIASSNIIPLGVLDFIGLAWALLCISGESLADYQLERFKAKSSNKGKTCRIGLWRYSRHPNYFFEWLHWFAYVFFAWHSPYILWTLLAPIAMFVFLFRITGIPHTEAQAIKSRGEDYKQYQKETSVFIPWFHKGQ